MCSLQTGSAASPVITSQILAGRTCPAEIHLLSGNAYNEAMKCRSPKILSYSVFYEHAPEGGYVASVPALPGCHTQGESLEEAERNIKEAIELYLASLAAHGESIPEEGPSFQGRVTLPA